MAGLRNILVHDYLEVDPAELRKHLGRLKDFERYCRYVVEYLRLSPPQKPQNRDVPANSR
jgi:uncharacterized protein YutE (UPF0331/DUF86 family)